MAHHQMPITWCLSTEKLCNPIYISPSWQVWVLKELLCDVLFPRIFARLKKVPQEKGESVLGNQAARVTSGPFSPLPGRRGSMSRPRRSRWSRTPFYDMTRTGTGKLAHPLTAVIFVVSKKRSLEWRRSLEKKGMRFRDFYCQNGQRRGSISRSHVTNPFLQ